MYSFGPISDTELAAVRQQCYQSLYAPLDGMWDTLIHKAVIKGIFSEQQCIGYFCHDHAFTLINFFVLRPWLNQKADIFKQLLKEEAFPQAYVSTNHPVFLNACMEFSKRVSVYYYLFEDMPEEAHHPTLPTAFEGADFVQAENHELQKLVDFCQQITSTDRAWLNQYIQEWLDKEGVFYLKMKKQILGICEIRKSDTQGEYADLGAIVSSQHRTRGLGTYLMLKGKQICKERGLKAICSCRYDNVGSRKMIEHAGFANTNLILKVSFLI